MKGKREQLPHTHVRYMRPGGIACPSPLPALICIIFLPYIIFETAKN